MFRPPPIINPKSPTEPNTNIKFISSAPVMSPTIVRYQRLPILYQSDRFFWELHGLMNRARDLVGLPALSMPEKLVGFEDFSSVISPNAAVKGSGNTRRSEGTPSSWLASRRHLHGFVSGNEATKLEILEQEERAEIEVLAEASNDVFFTVAELLFRPHGKSPVSAPSTPHAPDDPPPHRGRPSGLVSIESPKDARVTRSPVPFRVNPCETKHLDRMKAAFYQRFGSFRVGMKACGISRLENSPVTPKALAVTFTSIICIDDLISDLDDLGVVSSRLLAPFGNDTWRLVNCPSSCRPLFFDLLASKSTLKSISKAGKLEELRLALLRKGLGTVTARVAAPLKGEMRAAVSHLTFAAEELFATEPAYHATAQPFFTFAVEAENDAIGISNDDEVQIEFQKGELIGRGSYGAVYRCVNTRNGQFLALKVLPLTGNKEQQQAIRAEIDILRQLRHENIVQFYGSRFDVKKKRVSILMEYGQKTLADIVAEVKGLTLSLISHYAVKILQGLSFLHSQHLVHRDIKPQNVLVTANGEVKLSDMGTAMIVDSKKQQPATKIKRRIKVSPLEPAAHYKVDGSADEKNSSYFGSLHDVPKGGLVQFQTQHLVEGSPDSLGSSAMLSSSNDQLLESSESLGNAISMTMDPLQNSMSLSGETDPPHTEENLEDEETLMRLRFVQMRKKETKSKVLSNPLASESDDDRPSAMGSPSGSFANAPTFGIAGTPLFMAPELLHGGMATASSDIWAFGCLIMCLVTGSHPWREFTGGDKSVSTGRILRMISEAKEPPQLPPNLDVTEEFKDFLYACLQLDPIRRPSADELLMHAFLSEGGISQDGYQATDSFRAEGDGEVQSQAMRKKTFSFVTQRRTSAAGVGSDFPVMKTVESSVQSNGSILETFDERL